MLGSSSIVAPTPSNSADAPPPSARNEDIRLIIGPVALLLSAFTLLWYGRRRAPTIQMSQRAPSEHRDVLLDCMLVLQSSFSNGLVMLLPGLSIALCLGSLAPVAT